MADFATLSATANYIALLGQISDRDLDLSMALDPAHTTVATPAANMVRYNSANKRWESYSGSAWIELIAAATDAFAMTVTGLRSGTLYGTTTNSGTISGGTVDVTTLKQAGSAAWTAATLTNLNQLTNGPAFITAAALATYAPLASPTLTGTPAAPTAAVNTSTTQLATTAYVVNQGYLKAASAATTYLPLAGGALTGNLSSSGNISSSTVLAAAGSGTGWITAHTGDATHTGYMEFLAANANRQGYIGFSTTTGATDTGTINFQMGAALFSGGVSAASFSGPGTGLTGTAASLNIGGNAATAAATAMAAGRTDAAAYPVVWGTTGATSQLYSASAVTIQSSTGTLSATQFVGGGTGLTGVALLTATVSFHDITADRGDGTGVIFLNGANDRYLYWTGSTYQFNVASVTAAGGFVGNLNGNASSASIAAACSGNAASASAVAWANVSSKPLDSITMTTTPGDPGAGTPGSIVFVY